MTSQANSPLPDGAQLDEYRIERRLASGGFSFVYLARDAAGQPCAIKEYLPATLPMRSAPDAPLEVPATHRAGFRHGLQCFFAEAKALAQLRHPNVVRVLKFFRANGTAYMAMRYEPGRTLQQHIQAARAPLAEPWIRATFVMLLNGLREVHSNRLLHLDVKPANIYIRDDGDPVLIDFGAARAALGREFADLPPTYTPGFAAPEHHRGGGALGPWSDIYSIGASLYACLAAEPPPAASERGPHDGLAGLRRGGARRYTAALVQIIEECMRHDPERRPASVLALQKALLGEAAARRGGPSAERPAAPAWALGG
jgi:serine/threonine protein kinase